MSFEPIHSARTNHISFGAISLTGALAPESYITTEMTSELTSQSKDAGSYNTSISILSDSSGIITLQLQSQSTANIALTQLVAQDKANGGKTIANINVETDGTLYLYDFIGCFISQRPGEDKSVDQSGNTSTWTFFCSDVREKRTSDTQVSADIQISIDDAVQATLGISVVL